MADMIGDTITRLLAELEEGEIRAEKGWGIKTRDLRRYLKNLGGSLNNTESSFQVMGQKVLETFMGHFENEEGPDPLTGELITWDPYNYPDDPKQEAYITRKMRLGRGSKLMLSNDPDNEDTPISQRIMNPNNIKIKKGNNPGLEISAEIGYGIFGEMGFTGKNGSPTTSETRRPIFGLTPDEENNVINEMMDEFWRRVEE